ncbi:uncharacterized protein LOC124137093 [Haliotis rufescens]|uniref:uncharacterized protein LOC124137093 n=1 Tax=Haliotis rufescens TaxID=6454 RepID=UPI00201F7E02|nr:uncharacterized protein LOC124137093 [Haliotis rufescens]
MYSVESSDTPPADRNRPFLYPSPSWPVSGIGLLNPSGTVNEPQSDPLSGVDLLLQAAEVIESESTPVFDKPTSGINLLLEASEQIESCTSSRHTSSSQTPARSLAQSDAASSASVDALNPVDTAITWLENHIASIVRETHTRYATNDHTYAHPLTPNIYEHSSSTGASHWEPADPVDAAILWLEREIANSERDAETHSSWDKTESPSTDGPYSAQSDTSSFRPVRSHRRKINGSKITKVSTASGCTCLGQQKKTASKTTKSRVLKRRSNDRDSLAVCCAKKSKENKFKKADNLRTSNKCKNSHGNTSARSKVQVPSQISQKTKASWTSVQTTPSKNTSTQKPGTSGQVSSRQPLSGRSSTTLSPISRKRPVQIVIPTRRVHQPPALPTSAKRHCPMSLAPGGTAALGSPDTEARPLARHHNRLTINGVRRRRLGQLDESKSYSSRPSTSGTSSSPRPVGFVMPWIRSTTLHTNRCSR